MEKKVSEKKYLSLLSDALEVSHKRNILLKACEAALIFLNEEEYYQKSFEMTFVLEKLREAIAKAKGE